MILLALPGDQGAIGNARKDVSVFIETKRRDVLAHIEGMWSDLQAELEKTGSQYTAKELCDFFIDNRYAGNFIDAFVAYASDSRGDRNGQSREAVLDHAQVIANKMVGIKFPPEIPAGCVKLLQKPLSKLTTRIALS
jgi:hypothetical protein